MTRHCNRHLHFQQDFSASRAIMRPHNGRCISSCFLVSTKISSSARRFADPTVTRITSCYYYWGYLSFHTSRAFHCIREAEISSRWVSSLKLCLGISDSACQFWEIPYNNPQAPSYESEIFYWLPSAWQKFAHISSTFMFTSSKYIQQVTEQHQWRKPSECCSRRSTDERRRNLECRHCPINCTLTGIRLTNNATFAAWFQQIPKVSFASLVSPVAVSF